MINPYLPNTARKLLGMMKVVDKMLEWNNAGKSKLLSVGYTLRAPELLFRKIEDSEVAEQIGKLQKNEAKTAAADNTNPAIPAGAVESAIRNPQSAIEKSLAIKPEIIYEDFSKLDLRVGKIVSAEKVEKADKLLKLEVDLGFEKRTVVSGIAMHYKPEDIVGKQVVVVVNLAPRKMRGIESKGMILMAESSDGRLHFVNPEEAINPGAGVS
jgi:methionyl-tRNA synthetase